MNSFTEVFVAALKNGAVNFKSLQSAGYCLQKDDSGNIIYSYKEDSFLLHAVDSSGKRFFLKILQANSFNAADKYSLLEELCKTGEYGFLPTVNFLKKECVFTGEGNITYQQDAILLPAENLQSLKDVLSGMCKNNDIAGLEKIYNTFYDFVFTLLKSPFTHGNLNDQNILIDENGNIVLRNFEHAIFENTPLPKEANSGTENYVHPARSISEAGKHDDDFPLLVLLISVYGLAQRPDSFFTFKNDDGLLYSSKDFTNPENSLVTGFLYSINDEYLNNLLMLLQISSLGPSIAIQGLQFIISHANKSPEKCSRYLDRMLLEVKLGCRESEINDLKTRVSSLMVSVCESDHEKNILKKQNSNQGQGLARLKKEQKKVMALSAILVGLFSVLLAVNTLIPGKKIGSYADVSEKAVPKANVQVENPAEFIKTKPLADIKIGSTDFAQNVSKIKEKASKDKYRIKQDGLKESGYFVKNNQTNYHSGKDQDVVFKPLEF